MSCVQMEGFVGINWTSLLTVSKLFILTDVADHSVWYILYIYDIFWIFVFGRPNSEFFNNIISVFQYESSIWPHQVCFPVARHNWYLLL